MTLKTIWGVTQTASKFQRSGPLTSKVMMLSIQQWLNIKSKDDMVVASVRKDLGVLGNDTSY